MSAALLHTRILRVGFAFAAATSGAATLLAVFAWPALPYRPFDGTDAAVADFKQVEIELQPLGRLHEDQQTSLVAPAFRYNYGFAERWEYVVEGQVEEPVSPSIAVEFGPLLPGINADPGVGFSATGIVSQRFDWATVHFNVETNLTRDHRAESFLDVILEGPSKWKIRPVLEVYYDKVWTETDTFSALVGAIYQVRDDLSFDAAFRYAVVNGRPTNEIRAGLTFAFKVEGDKTDKTPVRPGPSFGNRPLSR
jgi:hypothetical protein